MVQQIDYLAIGPPVVLAVAALAVLLVDVCTPRRGARVVADVSLVGLVLAAGLAVASATGLPRATFCLPAGVRGGGPASCSYVVDEFTLLFQLVVLVAGVVVLLMSRSEIRGTRLPSGEFHFLLLASTAGAVALVAGRDLVTLVVCLEVASLPVFALVALRRYDGRSSEAGLKMFLVSVVSTAVMLYGISLVYAATGAVHLDRIAAALAGPDGAQAGPTGSLAAVGVVLVVVGFGFKVSVVPFHSWAPDTYAGAPVAVAAYLSVVSKAAGFAGLVLVLTVGFGSYAAVWGPLVAVLAAVTMTVGNLVAMRQSGGVRLLAWSSIAQAGYILAPLGAAAGVLGDRVALRELAAATVGYVAIYTVMNVGAFAVLGFVASRPSFGDRLDDHRGLARSHPLTAVVLAFFLSCLAGLPPGLAGLFAKIVVFRAVLTGGYEWLAVVMAVNTVLGLYYYLSWASKLFAPHPDGVVDRAPVPRAVGWGIGLAAAATVLLSVAPQLVLSAVPVGS